MIPIIVVGAGPTGLVLALSLARRNVSFRIIDSKRGPGEQSRAMGVHARTLEFYRQFGFADEVVTGGIIADQVHFRRHGSDGKEHEAARFRLSDMGDGISPYPFMLAYPQDDHERLLVSKLDALGVKIEWGTRLSTLVTTTDGVSATLDTDGTIETSEAGWIVGCDGARSIVRQSLNIGFAGGDYEQLFYVADVKIERGFNRDIYANLGEHSVAIMMPVRSSGMQRLIGLVPDALTETKDLAFDDLRTDIEALIGVTVTHVNWFSTYRVHHRVADRFRDGRAFIAGDAGHIHSPTGGQGMNTGIGDAINLGWKLAEVVRDRASEIILDSYEAERLPFAKRLVATTDRAFEGMIADGLKSEMIRSWLAPMAINIATRFEATKHFAFRTFSQTAISYLGSALSAGEAGIRGGERLPWVAPVEGEADNYLPLQSLDWQVHVYGKPEAALQETCEQLAVAMHVLPWTDRAHRANLRRNATYLVRPDGYIALASHSDSPAKLRAYAARLGLSRGLPANGIS